jgi:hypothetical protein
MLAQPCGAALVALSLAGILSTSSAQAQFGDKTAPDQPQTIKNEVHRWKVGMKVEAIGGPCQNLYGTVPVPTDWPGQVVRIVDEDVSPAVKSVRYRTLDGGVKQMMVRIPKLRAGQKAHALVTFEIEREQVAAPDNPDEFSLPKKLSRDARKYLAVSPYIEVRHPEIRELAKEIIDDSLPAWQRIEVIYDHVRDNVEYRNGKLKGALAALRDGHGDCEELSSLFIALCRANKIPARTVWVPNHCYPEFYLSDQDGEGRWFPCQAAGTRSFGTMPDLRPILQKGDSFKVPEKKERQRYVAEFLTGAASRGGGRPEVRFVRDVLPAS